MSLIFQAVGILIYSLFVISVNRVQTSCDFREFTPPQNLTEYNAFISITKLAYAPDNQPPDDAVNWMGYFGQIGGVNKNGTIYLIGGTYNYRAGGFDGALLNQEPLKWYWSINAYDSYISYDDSVDIQHNLSTIQSYWISTLFTRGYVMPEVTRPANIFGPTYTAGVAGGFYCDMQCSTYLNNAIFIIHPTMISQGLGTEAEWPVMIIFDMNDDFPRYYSESAFTSVPPNNYWANGPNDTIPFDMVQLRGGGCTTHNNTHVIHFNWAVSDVRYYHYPTTYAYHPPTNTWSLLTGNPQIKFLFTCSPGVSGRYIYLLAGTMNYWGLLHDGVPSYGTDKYDTWTDTFTRLPSTADYPEIYGRQGAISMLDSTTNSIIVTSGRIYASSCTTNCWVVVKKVEIFRCHTEDWFSPLDPTDEVYFDVGTKGSAMVKVDDFIPNGQVSNASADVIFVMGGGSATKARNDIQFISILTEREYYPDNAVRIEGQHPDDEAIESTSFDPWQRFELSFRIVITDGIGYEIDDSWNISFTIDGKGVYDLNEEYNTQILTRPACQCGAANEKVWCENVADNVQQVTIVELMIPSRRTLHNGYCVDKEVPWIFSYENNSNITVTATNGHYTHSRDFEFEFMRIELINANQSAASGVMRGCQVMNESSGTLTHFAIRCDGYTCDNCPKFDGIGRDSKGGRQKTYLMNEIEYNVLMNGVLLAPDAYIRQDFEENRVIGTESLNTDSLIAIIRARTAIGTWYQECFYHFSYEWTQKWQSLPSILNQTTNEDLWNEVIEKLNSEKNEDVIAAYSIFEEMVIEEQVPPGDDPVAEMSIALEHIMDRMDPNDENVTMDDITTNLALIDLLTSDSDLVPPDIVLTISSAFIPSVLRKALSILNDSEADYEPGVLADTVQNVGQLANSAATNLLNVTNLTETERQEVLHDVQQIMTTGLTGSWQGEVLLLEHDGSKTKGYTLPKDEACEMDDISVAIPPHNAATSSDTLRCVITTTNEDELAIDLFDGSGTRVFATNDSCLPYFITMNLPDGSDAVFARALAGNWHNASHQFPKCTFWNRSEENWSGKGCFVYAMDADSITCACSHLTTFKISAEEFDPKPHLLTADDARQITAENLGQHPATWVTMVMMVAVLLLACICAPNNNADRPLIAFEDIIYKEFRDEYLHKHQQWHELQQIDRWYGKVAEHKRGITGISRDRAGSASFASSSSVAGVFGVGSRSPSASVSSGAIVSHPFAAAKHSKYYCLLSVNLFRTYLKNDHTVLSVFERSDGTNLSTKQRIALFVLYMHLIMMADAMFYGAQEDRRPMGELTASALISLFATFPVYLIRNLFVWSKPIVVKGRQPSRTVEDAKEEVKISQYWAAIAKLKHTKRPDMKLVRECMHYVNTEAHASEKATLAQEIRLILFNYNYPFPNWCKKIAWAILIVMAAACIATSVIYGIRFDVRADQMAIELENQRLLWSQLNNITNDSNGCWNMSMQLVAQSEVLRSEIEQIKEEQARIESLMEPYPDDLEALFGDAAIYDSTKWLFNVLISFLTSVFVWQPASIYFVTWLKIWAFDNGLVMEFSYSNLAMFLVNYLCCGWICGGFSKRKKKGKAVSHTSEVDKTELTTVPSSTAATTTVTHATITAAPDLPSASRGPGLCTSPSLDMLLDDNTEFQVLSLLCDDDFFLPMPHDDKEQVIRHDYLR